MTYIQSTTTKWATDQSAGTPMQNYTQVTINSSKSEVEFQYGSVCFQQAEVVISESGLRYRNMV